MVLSVLVARALALAQQLGACVDYFTRWGDETSKISAWVWSSRFKLLVKEERERIHVAPREAWSAAREVAIPKV